MIKRYLVSVAVLLLVASHCLAQTSELLHQQLQQIVSTKNAVVGISIAGQNLDTLSINGDVHFPLQSVFKLHIALAVLEQIDRGLFSLDQKITIEKKDLLPGFYSPLRDKYPNGGALPLSEILYYTVSKSDNVGCDRLIKLIGGPHVVENYFIKNNFKDVSIKINEEVQQSKWNLQFLNWTTPNAATGVLTAFYNTKLLSKKSYNFIWKIMRETETGKDRLKAQLPKGTIVAHKTGTSATNEEGLTAAVNDIGVVSLPNGQAYMISVFITNSLEGDETNAKIIADISEATWKYFVTKSKKL